MVLFASVGPNLVFISGVGSSSTHGWEKIANGAAVLVFVALGVRIARMGIFADHTKLVVRDYFRTYRIGWRKSQPSRSPPGMGNCAKPV